MTGRRYSTQRWAKVRDRFRAECARRRLPCAACRTSIDYGLRRPHPDAFEADHIEPVRDRPELLYELSNLRPAHARCNQSRGADAISGDWVQPQW
jgi:hypothetical protein